jgi:hypothetical protein
LHLAKLPGFPDPFAINTTKKHEKQKNAFTVSAHGGAKGAKGA